MGIFTGSFRPEYRFRDKITSKDKLSPEYRSRHYDDCPDLSLRNCTEQVMF